MENLILDCTTGQQLYIPLSAEEMSDVITREIIEKQRKTEEETKRLADNKFYGQKFIDLSSSDKNEFLLILLKKLNVVDKDGLITAFLD